MANLTLHWNRTRSLGKLLIWVQIPKHLGVVPTPEALRKRQVEFEMGSEQKSSLDPRGRS